MIDHFFVVWNPGRGLPRFRHDSHEAAKTEAKRLARQHPGEEFYVLAATGRAMLKDPVDWDDCDEIPF